MTKKPKTKQIIYIVTNEAMPDYCKIGKTNDLRKRLKDLYTTSVPLPFEKHFACEVNDAEKEERWLHKAFKKFRVSKNREFFKADIIETVVEVLRDKSFKEIKGDLSIATKTEKKEISKKRTMRSRFDFEKYGIKPGAEIYFSRNESIKAKVLPKNQIKFKGKTTSLSQSATLLLGSKRQVSGTLYWKYGKETLDERRTRMDERRGR